MRSAIRAGASRTSATGSKRRFGTIWCGPASVTASDGSGGAERGCMATSDCSMTTGSPTDSREAAASHTGQPHNPWREAVQERVVRQIRMLRAMWRELETGLRLLLTGHEGGNPRHSQGVAYESPRQFPTLPTQVGGESCTGAGRLARRRVDTQGTAARIQPDVLFRCGCRRRSVHGTRYRGNRCSSWSMVTVEVGSFDYTAAAEGKYAENPPVLHDRAVAARFAYPRR